LTLARVIGSAALLLVGTANNPKSETMAVLIESFAVIRDSPLNPPTEESITFYPSRDKSLSSGGAEPIELIKKLKSLAGEVGGVKNLLRIVTLLTE
ncbi:hypothetical protein, partial [Staphylococcus epidermidis]|uniref:hypothetical protein n=1 Tax=Staphylococcus epidermidis TaxID=1282 RepID=UPI00301D377C